jgi:hypothetical protein
MGTLTASFRTRSIALMVVLLTAAVSGSSYGSSTSTTIGMVKQIKDGVLERQDRDVWNPLVVNAEIHANDRVRTSTGATAVLTLNDVGTVLIGPNAEYYLGDPSRGFKSLLKRGYLWISAKLRPGATMSVATSNAVAGVRGTKFSVIKDAQGMDVCTCTGEVQVTPKDGKSMNVTSGMFGSVTAAGKVVAPEKGKPHLEKIWKENPPRYAPCLNCHKKGKKIGDLD